MDKVYIKRDTLLKNIDDKEKKINIKKGYKKRSKIILIISLVILVGTIITIKYLPFFADNLNRVLVSSNAVNLIRIPKFIVPIGISFFVLSAISYLVDVYTEKIKADYNLFRLSLFLSFFPQIIEGPICRYEQTANQLWNICEIKYDNFILGIERILYGLLKKCVIADRLNPLITELFDKYYEYNGIFVIIAGISYTIQLYADFSGSMDAVIGISQIFGVIVPENFRQPFFSKTISEFWNRWHISLGSWFSDYVFYPITMSKTMKSLTLKIKKKYNNHFGPIISSSIALLCVWLLNGLWHGAGWTFIFYGLYHFFFILLGNICDPISKKLSRKLSINSDSIALNIFKIVRTTILVCVGETIFRANDLKTAKAMFSHLMSSFSISKLNLLCYGKLGIDYLDILIVFITLSIVFFVSFYKERGVSVRSAINTKNNIIKYGIIISLIVFIAIFGAYGPGYIPIDPMYANF